MGAQFSQVQAPQTSQGKSGPAPQAPQQLAPPEGQSDGISRPAGKGGQITYPGQSGQPQMGKPNQYPNTVGSWDNATINTQPVGKGKGA